MIFGDSYTRKNDTDLVFLISNGDEKAFGELLKRHQNAVYSFAFRLLGGDAREAEDVAQETFLRLFRISASYNPTASLRTFLFKITKNLCIDLYRKKRPGLTEEFPDIPEKETPLDLLEKVIEAEQLENAIKTLPVNQRAALLLRHKEQMPYNQIANVMGVSVSAVESLLVRARQKLRKKLSSDIQ